MTEIEQALAASWTIDNLAVYGDHLQQLGDPRGELVAVDVHIARHGRSPELDHRRRRAIRAWFGLADTIDPTRGIWESVRFAFGFIDDVRYQMASRILASPAGPYVRGITLTHKHTSIAGLLEELGHTPRPWLERLSILPRFKSVPAVAVWHASAGLLPTEALPRMIANTPRLSRLEIAGHRTLRAFPHPHVTSLRIDGIDAFLPILEPGEPMRSVTELALSFARAPGEPVVMAQPWPALVPVESFPALRRLDLSSNEGYRAETDTQVDVFDVLPRIDVLAQLHELCLPSIRTSREEKIMRRVLKRMPALRRLEVMGRRHAIERDGLEVVQVDTPWPDWNEAAALGPLWVRCSARPRDVFELEPRPLIQICDRSFRWFDVAAREAWTVVWHTIQTLSLSNNPAKLPTATLRQALEAVGFLDASFPELRPWAALRERIRELTAGEVQIARFP